MECKLIVHPLAHGIFQISDAMHGPNSDGYSTEPGKATANSYLIIGEERAVLIDLTLNTPELYAYAQSLAGKPILVHDDGMALHDLQGSGFIFQVAYMA